MKMALLMDGDRTMANAKYIDTCLVAFVGQPFRVAGFSRSPQHGSSRGPVGLKKKNSLDSGLKHAGMTALSLNKGCIAGLIFNEHGMKKQTAPS